MPPQLLSRLTALAGWFLLFILYSFIGWCGETVYCSIGQRKLCEKRGFLNGFLCPIYGHGALLVLCALRGGCASPVLTFLFGLLLTSAVEYVTSCVMERLFHMRWWDYSHYRFQLNGRVCLLNSTLFGLACVFLCHYAHPRAMVLINAMIRRGSAIPLALLIFVVYAVDIVISVRSAIQIGSRLEKLHALQEELQHKLEELKAEQLRTMAEHLNHLEEAVENRMEAHEAQREARKARAMERLQARVDSLDQWGEAYLRRWEQLKSDFQRRSRQLMEAQDYFERRLMLAHPTLRSAKHSEALQRLREFIKNR
jgi:uncharacterized membrane protein